jgi:hypothetical protein
VLCFARSDHPARGNRRHLRTLHPRLRLAVTVAMQKIFLTLTGKLWYITRILIVKALNLCLRIPGGVKWIKAH